MRRAVAIGGVLLLVLAGCGTTPDPASATSCEETIDIFFDFTQDYLDVVSEIPPGAPLTDAAIEAERVLEEDGGWATAEKLEELGCDVWLGEAMWCDGLPELDTGSYGKQQLKTLVEFDC